MSSGNNAPNNAQYWVGSANIELENAIVPSSGAGISISPEGVITATGSEVGPDNTVVGSLGGVQTNFRAPVGSTVHSAGASSVNISSTDTYAHWISTEDGARVANLPTIATGLMDGKSFLIVNGSTSALTIKDANASVVITLEQNGDTAIIMVLNNTWYVVG